MTLSFTAIDFETATGHPESACAVGIVTVENGIIIDEYVTLIQPPNNEYWYRNIMCHGIQQIGRASCRERVLMPV